MAVLAMQLVGSKVLLDGNGGAQGLCADP